MDKLLLPEPFLTGKPLEVWLASMGIKDWSINGELVNVQGNVNLDGKLEELKRLPVRFGKVGHFSCSNNQLVSLEGAPEKVGGWFSCDNNQLVSLEGGPNTVGGTFNCNHNQLVSLEGAPKEVGGNFWCSNNQLVSLEGAPKKVGGCFYCHENQLVSLEGAPKKVGGDFGCDKNQLVSLEGAPEKVGGAFSCSNNQLVSLEGALKQVGGSFHCSHNLLVDFKGMEGVSIKGNLYVTAAQIDGPDNVFVSLEGLPKELYRKMRCYDTNNKVVVFDIQALISLDSQHSDIPDIEI